MFMRSLESGERAKSVKMTMITRHGKRRTRPNGTERDESLVSRTRRFQKLFRGAYFAARRGASSVFSGLSSFAFGCLLVRSWKRAIAGTANVCCPRQRSQCWMRGEDVVCAGRGAVGVVVGAEGQRRKFRAGKERPGVVPECETNDRAHPGTASE
jgi:hypothetical protein